MTQLPDDAVLVSEAIMLSLQESGYACSVRLQRAADRAALALAQPSLFEIAREVRRAVASVPEAQAFGLIRRGDADRAIADIFAAAVAGAPDPETP